MTKLKHIDSIRGIAILLVILTHTSQAVGRTHVISNMLLAYSQMGVQLFFVASAYTLCLSATNRRKEKNADLNYAIRRYFRIAPAYYLALLLFLLVHVVDLWQESGQLGIPERYTWANILANVFFVHGFYGPANNVIVPGGWSIGTEMAFYVIFPALFIFLKEGFAPNWLGGILIILFSLLIQQTLLLSVNALLNLHVTNNNFMYFNIVTEFPVFSIGIMYFMLERKIERIPNLYVIALFFLTTIFNLFMWNLRIDHLFCYIPVVAGVSFVFLIEIFKRYVFLNSTILARIGIVSYSMYLLHTLFAHKMSKHLIGEIKPILGSDFSLVALFGLSVLATFILALFSERYIEKPFVNLGKSLIKKISKPLPTAFSIER